MKYEIACQFIYYHQVSNYRIFGSNVPYYSINVLKHVSKVRIVGFCIVNSIPLSTFTTFCEPDVFLCR